MSAPSLGPLLASKEILIFCGSGGVGKTSIAASSALAAASRLGGKVLVLTIDPAKRLADALGLEGIGNTERRVPDAVLKAAGVEMRGELWAAMLDTKQSWDALVLRHAPDREAANRILENPLYANITSRFVQSHDYIAMERLFDLHESGAYDTIIVDTPPSRNALDFLDAPGRMADFFGGRLLRWLTLPYRATGSRGARVFSLASRPFTSIVDRMLGGAFVSDIAEFFVNFQAMYDGFVARARHVEQLLRDRRTAFVVVTTLEPAPLHEAEFFCSELVHRHYELGALVCNKTLPPLLADPTVLAAASILEDDAERIAGALAEAGLDDVARTSRILRTLAETYAGYALLATRERELRVALQAQASLVIDVPQLGEDVADIGGLAQLASTLLADGERSGGSG